MRHNYTYTPLLIVLFLFHLCSGSKPHTRLFLECENAQHLRTLTDSLKYQTFQQWVLYVTIRNHQEHTRAQAIFSDQTLKNRVVLLDGNSDPCFTDADIILEGLHELKVPTTLADIVTKYAYLFTNDESR